MDKKTALKLLNLPLTASPANIKTQYQKLYTAFQAKITHAPNAVLKQKFEQNFIQLQQAYQVLQETRPHTEFLPSTEPVVEAATVEAEKPTSPAPSTPTLNPPKEKSSMSKIPILIAIFAVSAATLFFVLWRKNSQEIKVLSPFKKQVEQYDKNFQNRVFTLKNVSETKADFKVHYYKLFYIDDTQELQQEEGYPNALVKYGSSFSDVQKVEGSEMIFDGRALFYTFVLMPTTTGYPYFDSGIIKNDDPILVNPVFQ